MAYHEFDSKSGFYRICYKFGGKRYKRSLSLKITELKRANAMVGIVGETIRDIERGVLTIPEGIDPGDFIESGGRLTKQPVTVAPPKALSLKEMFDLYVASIQPKEDNTRGTERTHIKHLLRIIGRDVAVESMEKKDVQAYIDKRSSEKYKRTGEKTKGQTIHKEVGTLSVIANWAKDAGLIKSGIPTQKLRYPKGEEKEPFRSWDECVRAVERLSKGEQRSTSKIWESLFLSEDEILAVIEHIRDKTIYPMIVFAACTGARRSEMCRAEVGDVDLVNGQIRIREKKRDRSKTITFRSVPLHEDLRGVLTTYLERRQTSNHLFCGRGSGPLTKIMATKRFRQAMKNSKWSVLHGWHTFRHSFASSLARQGTSQAIIDALMGHETEAMRKRYRHLFPQDLSESVGRLFARRP